MIKVGATGSVCRGHVLDVGVKSFERALRDYDKQLYVLWNPQKLKGFGCWEIRRKPECKTARKSERPKINSIGQMVRDGIPGDVHEFDNYTIVYPKYHELDILHHVLDCAFLNYDQLRKIKDMDTWNKSHWVHDIDYREKKAQEKIQTEAIDELKYAIRYNKKAFKDYMELVKSGMSPHQVLSAGDKWEYKS